jgi:hypothetical protein
VVLARPQSSWQTGCRAAAPRLSSEDAGAGSSPGSGSRGARGFASASGIQWVDATGSGAANFRCDWDGLSGLSPGCGPSDRSGD